MKLIARKLHPAVMICCSLLASLLTGCGGMQYAADPINPEKPFVFPGQENTPTITAAVTPATSSVNLTPVGNAGGSQPRPVRGTSDLAATVPTIGSTPATPGGAGILRVGDKVTVSFSDTRIIQEMPTITVQLAEDGKITLPYNVVVSVVGKTARQLEQEIRSEYVPRLFNYLTVTVKTDERAYYVSGEVKIPNRQAYIGEMTVLRAIDTAGGFTDFANRKKIELRRENGEKATINWHKAVKDPKLDPPVYPNDQVIVHKRIW